MGRGVRDGSYGPATKCFICCKDVSVPISLENPKSKVTATPISLSSKISKDGSEIEDENCLKEHVTVIFILRKFFGVQQNMCQKFLQNFGSPSSWIHWCSCCSFYLNEAKKIFDEMELLEKKLESLRAKLANDVFSSTNDDLTVPNSGSIDEPRKIVRSFITKKYSTEMTHFPKVEVKLETDSDYEQENCEENICVNDDFVDENYYDEPKDPDVINDGEMHRFGTLGGNTKSLEEKARKEESGLQSEEKVHKCDICSRSMSTKKALGKHRLTHPPPCLYCNKVFILKKDFLDHVPEHEGDELKNNECIVCGEALNSFKEVSQHQCVRFKPLSCSLCGMTFTREDVLKKHEMQHKGPKPYACSTCEKTFSNSYALKCHEYTHTGAKPYPCPCCNSGFSLACDLKRHIERLHIQEKSHMCSTCGKAFSVYQDLKSHEKVHTDLKPFSCDQCDKRFLTMRRLTVHMRTHTGERPFSCATCGASFRDKTDLGKHEKRHSGERPHLCTLCGKSFATGFARHLQSHKGERPFSCPVCGKTFASARTAEEHQSIHSGEKPFDCGVCGKKFRFERLLRLHEKTHTGIKSHLCMFCGKSFYYAKSLKVHLKNHSEEPLPYPCRFCNKRFITSNTLKEHERTHTGERPFSCLICFKAFKRSSHLKNHELKCDPGKQKIMATPMEMS